MKKEAMEEAIDRQTKEIWSEFIAFTEGYHVLFLIHRNKEGGGTNNTKLRKLVSRNADEYYKHLRQLVSEKFYAEEPLRIYASVNERNFAKAIRQFKHEQLDADDYDIEQKENFYRDIKNRFIGCLMQPAQRATSFFLYDIDNEDGKDMQGEALQLIPNELIVKMYKTKNGWHIITKPFNHTTINLPKGITFVKDGLLLLSY